MTATGRRQSLIEINYNRGLSLFFCYFQTLLKGLLIYSDLSVVASVGNVVQQVRLWCLHYVITNEVLSRRREVVEHLELGRKNLTKLVERHQQKQPLKISLNSINTFSLYSSRPNNLNRKLLTAKDMLHLKYKHHTVCNCCIKRQL